MFIGRSGAFREEIVKPGGMAPMPLGRLLVLVYGVSYWQYLAAHPHDAAHWNAMFASSRLKLVLNGAFE